MVGILARGVLVTAVINVAADGLEEDTIHVTVITIGPGISVTSIHLPSVNSG